MALTELEINALKPDCTAAAAIEAKAENVAVGKVKLENLRCFALAVLAGMFIASGALFMTYVKSDATLPFAVSQVFGAAMFSLGLIMVIVAGAELFTGNNLMVMAALSKKCTWTQVLKNWVIVYLGNLVGSLVIVGCAFGSNCMGMNGGEVGSTMMTIAAGKIGLDPGVILFRGIMCNFLVCMAVWMGFAGRTVIDKIFTSAFPVTAFVAMGFEHCVANMFFLPMGLVAKASGVVYAGTANVDLISLGGILYNISLATVGNIIGGAVFVGVMYWIAYAKRSRA
ncbi:MAG: formate/nitrite transporter family protein [Eggerthellaceae bacterium]